MHIVAPESPEEATAHIFEERIRAVKGYLNTQLRYNNIVLPRPIFVELLGPPSSGKTTIIKELYKSLKRNGLKIKMPQEGAEVIPHTERDTPVYNIRTGLYALQIFLNLRGGHEYDVVFFDRGIFDPYTWMIRWYEDGKLSEEDMRRWQKSFVDPLWAHDMDAAYVIVCDPAIAVEREYKKSPDKRLGATTNPEFMERLIRYNNRMLEELSGTYPQLRLFDTTHVPEEEMARIVAEDLFKSLTAKIKI